MSARGSEIACARSVIPRINERKNDGKLWSAFYRDSSILEIHWIERQSLAEDLSLPADDDGKAVLADCISAGSWI